MSIVGNRLPLATPIEDAPLAKINAEFIPGARTRPGCRSVQLVRNSDTKAVVIVQLETREASGEYRRSTPHRGSVSTSCPTSLVQARERWVSFSRVGLPRR